jgi:hypothetical protein
MTDSKKPRPRWAATLAATLAGTLFAGLGLVGAVGAGPAGASVAGAAKAGSSGRGEMHFYSADDQFTYARAGRLLATPPESSEAGDVIQFTDLDYVGHHEQHAKVWTATDHGVCVFSSATAASCFIQFAIGDSMLLAEGPLSMTDTLDIPIVGGTGIYAGITGEAVSVNLEPHSPNSPSDVTLTFHR